MDKPKAKLVKDNSERYLLTYADLMNLLLILFIVLYSMSQVDTKKFEQLSNSLRNTFGENVTANSIIGVSQGGNSLIDLGSNAPAPVIPSKLEDLQMLAVQKEITGLIKEHNLTNDIEVSMEERGVVISIKSNLLFNIGSAEVAPGSKMALNDIGKILQGMTGNQIRIEGHTDNDAINTAQFPSNWELSSARAANVLRFLVDNSAIDPQMISSVGYAEFRPKVPNNSLPNKAANRRVNIVVVKNIFDKVEAGTPTTPNGVPTNN